VQTQKPLNHYLKDEDVAKVLRVIYSDSTKEALMADEGIMTAFYGKSKGKTIFPISV